MTKEAFEDPWQPMTRPADIRPLGKLGEEVTELGTAIFRCLIQGIEESEPVTNKPNREWIEDEIADVQATAELAVEHFGLDAARIAARKQKKQVRLRAWMAGL